MQPHQETLAYYDRNATAYCERTRGMVDRGALMEFTRRLPRAGRVLDAGFGSARDVEHFARQGYRADGFDASEVLVKRAAERFQGREEIRVWQADFLFLKLEREAYDGVWANRSLIHLPPEGCQRTLANFFLALRPGGTLFVSIEAREGDEGQSGRPEGNLDIIQDRTDDPFGPARHLFRYRSDDFASLLRQSGFRLLLEGRNPTRPGRMGFLAERI